MISLPCAYSEANSSFRIAIIKICTESGRLNLLAVSCCDLASYLEV